MEAIESEINARRQVSSYARQAIEIATQNEFERQKLEIQKQSLVEQLRVLEASGKAHTEEAQHLREQIKMVEVEILEKADAMRFVADRITEGMYAITAGLVEGNVEAMKEGYKKALTMIVAYLQKVVTTTITTIVLNQLGLASTGMGITSLLLVPVIKAVVTAGVNAIMSPIYASLSKFASGGRVDKETLAVVGFQSLFWWMFH